MDGIPALASGIVRSTAISLLGIAQSAIWRFFTHETEWGVYKSGTSEPAVEVDSVVEMGQRKGAQVPSFRIENGSFANYNKVEISREVHVVLSKGGSEYERSQFLLWLQTNVKAPTLFDVISPEQRFLDMTLIDYRIDRDSGSGVTVIFAECIFQEIRQVAVTYYKSTQSPNDAAATPTAKAQPEWRIIPGPGGPS